MSGDVGRIEHASCPIKPSSLRRLSRLESAVDHPISSQHTPIVPELSGHAIRSVGRLRPGRGANNDEGGLRAGASATEKQDMIHVYIMKTVENRLEAGVKTVNSH